MNRYVLGASFLMLGCYASAADTRPCPDMVKYVCAGKNGQAKTYMNSCFADKDGATLIQAGKCPTRWPVDKQPH
jgi:hypothetical protein